MGNPENTQGISKGEAGGENQRVIEKISVTTTYEGDRENQPDIKRVGQLLQSRQLEPLFHLCKGLDRKEGKASPDASKEAKRFRLEEMEQSVAVPEPGFVFRL